MILHIVNRDDWQRALADGSYTPKSLKTEGFVHCSTALQVVQTAKRFFPAQQDLLLLSIDEQRLSAAVRWEPPAHAPAGSNDSLFPHIYGLVNLDAVTQVHEFPCEIEGSFRLPQALASALERGNHS